MAEFLQFIRKRPLLAAATALTAVLTYGALALHADDILTDSEAYIADTQNVLDVFIRNGRFGIVLTKFLFSTCRYMPFLFLLSMMLTLVIAALLFDSLVSRIIGAEREKEIGLFSLVFNVIWLSCPVFIQQFYFYYQAFEVSFAMLLVLLGAFWAFETARGGKKRLLPALLCMVWSFGTYQVLAPLALAAGLSYLLLAILYEREEVWLRVGIRLAGIFLLGLLLYLAAARAVSYLVFSGEAAEQLSDTYILWGKLPATQNLQYILHDMIRVFFSRIPVYSPFYLPVFLTFLFFLLAEVGERHAGNSFLLVAVGLGLTATPFLMAVLEGNFTIIRSQLVYPFVLAFLTASLALFLFRRAWKWKGAAFVGYLGLAALLFTGQTAVSNQYAGLIHAVAQSDRDMVLELKGKRREALLAAGLPETAPIPVIRAGARKAVISPGLIAGLFEVSGDATGISFFEIDEGKWASAYRLSLLFSCEGIPSSLPSMEQYETAIAAAADMPVYPAEGSVRYLDNGVLVVKMSNME